MKMTMFLSDSMMNCILDQFIWERRITISKIAKETGISRTTLTNLKRNNEKGIQFQTLALLLQYLDCSFDDIFEVSNNV